jgi:hypothetical protein
MNITDRINQRESFLVANDGQFLGKLSLNQFDSESISNSFGSFGSQFSLTSIKNQFSQYGSPFSSLSPYNKFSGTPPTIYLRGYKYGYLTKNNFISGKTLDPDLLEDWIKKNNLIY